MLENPVKRYLAYLCWVVSTICLFAAGIGCLFNQASSIEMLAGWISVLIFVAGIGQFAVTLIMHKLPMGSRSFTSKALMIMILGLVMLLKSVIAAEVVRVMASVVMLFGGLVMLNAVWDMRRSHLPLNAVLWILSAIEAVLGFLGFTKFVMSGMTFGTAIGIGLIYEAVLPAILMTVTILYTLAHKPGGPRHDAQNAASAAEAQE